VRQCAHCDRDASLHGRDATDAWHAPSIGFYVLRVFDARVSEVSRRLRARADVILGVVWYTPEARDGYPGIACSPGTASLAARAACLGRVRGAAVAAIFAAIEPTEVERRIDEAWAIADPERFCTVRLDASVRALQTVIGDDAPGIDRALELLRRALDGASK
jgi:hypothetical protein